MNRLERFGPTHEAVQYSSKQSQFKRFEILASPIKPTDSVIDVGCGLGDMLTYLRKEKDFKGQYLGLDFVPEFIEHANSKYKNDKIADFIVFDIINDQLPRNYDVILLSGVFNNQMEDNWEFISTSIKKMFDSANRLVSFNGLSIFVDYQDEGLYYMDPLKIFKFCKTKISPFVTLRHDYLVKQNSIPFEFTLYIFK